MSSKKNPIDQAKDLLIEALKDPKSAAGNAVGTARETAAIGKMMAGQLSRFAVSEAGGLAGELLSRVAGPCGSLRQSTTAEPTVSGPIAVPDPDAPEPTAAPDPAETAADAPAEKAAKKPAKKTAKKTAKKAAKKAAAKKATKKAAAKTESGSDMPTPADIAENVAPATKAAAKKSAASRRTTKAAETGTSSGSPAEESLPRADTDVRDSVDVDVTTPVATVAAGEATNPDTDEPDLEQPDAPPLMDPGTVHAVQSEADILRKAADPDKG